MCVICIIANPYENLLTVLPNDDDDDDDDD